MKVVLITPFFLPQVWGIEKVVYGQAKGLAELGHEVHVITSHHLWPKGKFEGLPSEERVDGFTIHRIDILLRSPSKLFFYSSNSGFILRGLTKKLNELAPDILHVHNVASPMWAYLAARYASRLQKKFFYSLHYHPDGLSLPKWHMAVVHALNRLPIRCAKRLYQLTRQDFALFKKEYPQTKDSQLAVLPNGVNRRSFEPVAALNGQFRLLFVGRVEDKRKGFDLLEETFRACRQPHWCLTVVGVVSEAKKASLSAEFGSAIRVLGEVNEADLEREYASTDLFVMPSRYEGFGMPYIEAMRYGVAVVGTTAGGIPDTVPPETGILVPVDDQAALSSTVQRLAESESERLALGQAGLRWSERFQWNVIVKTLEADYETC